MNHHNYSFYNHLDLYLFSYSHIQYKQLFIIFVSYYYFSLFSFGVVWSGHISKVVTCEAGTANPSGTHEFTLVFSGVRVTRFLVLCVVFCRSLFFFLFFFFTDSDYPFDEGEVGQRLFTNHRLEKFSLL